MPLWKKDGFVENLWTIVADDADLPADGNCLISLARWRKERDMLVGRNAGIGLVIQPGEDWDDLIDDLRRFPVIAVTIPKYADGRAFSITRRLRQRDGYQGEIRAVGAYIIDQVPMLDRVGVDAFLTDDPILIAQLERGEWPEVAHFLQPVDADEVAAGPRPWMRLRADV